MPEYRTTDGMDQSGAGDPDGDASSGTLDLDGIGRMIYDRIRDDPDSQRAVASALNQNYGIPAEILAPLFPAIQDSGQSQQRQQRQLPDGGDPDWIDQQQPEASQSGHDPLSALEPQDVGSFLDEVIAVAGEDMTLSELRTFVAENPGMVETALRMA